MVLNWALVVVVTAYVCGGGSWTGWLDQVITQLGCLIASQADLESLRAPAAGQRA
jgi:hypothetical protein